MINRDFPDFRHAVPKLNPVRFKTHITKLIRAHSYAKTLSTVKTLVPVTEEPEWVVEANRNRIRRGSRKRLKLIQVDQDGVEVPEMVPTTRQRRVNKRSVLKSSKVVTTTLEKLRDNRRDDKNICVLFTNFTSEGDYINDHDYLINPYIRNKMYYHQGTIPVCICLLCDLVHQAKDHVDHMRSHRTVCNVCQVDFHNAFILNLHVRCHSTFCSECRIKVSYAGHYPHAQEHNRSVTLSNIDIPKVIEEYLYQPEALPPQQEKEKEPPPTNKDFITLKELLNAPIDDKNCRLSSFSSSSPSISPRRSSRIIRSRKLEIEDPSIEDEEACIYDKTTKSFITPSAEKQQRLLKQCTSNKEKTESNKDPKEASVDQDGNDREAVKDNETEISDIHTSLQSLLCEESIGEKTDTEISNINTILATETTIIPVQSVDVTQKQDSITTIKPMKSKWRKRRRVFSTKRKKVVKIEPQGNEDVSESPESANSKIGDSSKPDVVSETKSDLEATDNSDVTKKHEQSGVLQGLDQKNADLSKMETSEKAQTSSGKKSTMRKVGKRSGNKYTATIVDIVRTYSRPNRKRRRVGDSEVIAHETPLVENEVEVTATQPQGSDIKKEEIAKNVNIVKHSTTQTDALKTKSVKAVDALKTKSGKTVRKKPGTLKQRKKSESPVTLNSESSEVVPPRNSSVKSKSDKSAPSKKSDPTSKKPVANSALSLIATAASSLVKRSLQAGSKIPEVTKRQKSGPSKTEAASGTNSKSSIITAPTNALVKTKSVKAVSKKVVVPRQRKSDLSKTESPSATNNPPTTSKLVKTKSVKAGSKKSEGSKQEPPRNWPITADTERESSQDGEVKSPLRGDLKMKIKSLKYNPFVSLTNLETQMSNANEQLPTDAKVKSKACDKTSRKRKRDIDDSEVVDPAPLVHEEGILVADNIAMQQPLRGTVDVKETVKDTSNEGLGKGALPEGDDDKKNVRSNTGTGRKARSSRSRGSLGLVEGLKFHDKRWGSRKLKKSEQDSVDLDTSHSTNADLNASSGLEVSQSDGASPSTLEASQADDATPNDSIPLQKAQLEEHSLSKIEEPTASSQVDLKPSEVKDVESNESSAIVDDRAEHL